MFCFLGSVSPGSPDFVVESAGTKRPNPAGPYVDEASGGPTSSKRRHCDRSNVANVGSQNVGGQNVGPPSEPTVGQQSGSVVRGGVIMTGPGPVLSPAGAMSPSNRCASPPQVRKLANSLTLITNLKGNKRIS